MAIDAEYERWRDLREVADDLGWATALIRVHYEHPYTGLKEIASVLRREARRLLELAGRHRESHQGIAPRHREG